MLDEEQDAQYSRDGEHGSLAVLYDCFINTALKISPERGLALDVACGAGQLLAKLARSMPDMQFLGTDISPHMLNLAAQNAQRFGAHNLRLQRHSMYELASLGEARFDLVTYSLALHHCDNEQSAREVLNGIAHVLKPGGSVLIFDILRPKTGALALSFADKFNRAEGSWYYQDSLDSYKAAFTFSELEDILKTSALKNYRHVTPTVGNFFQFVYISSQSARSTRRVSHLQHLWQKRDYLMLQLGFLGKIK